MSFWGTLERGTGKLASVAGDIAMVGGAATGNPAVVAGGAALHKEGQNAENVGKPLPIRASSMTQATSQDNARLGAVYGGGFKSSY